MSLMILRSLRRDRRVTRVVFTIRAVAVIKVGRDGKIAGAGETLGHVPHELVDAALMLNHDHRGERARAVRRAQMQPH